MKATLRAQDDPDFASKWNDAVPSLDDIEVLSLTCLFASKRSFTRSSALFPQCFTARRKAPVVVRRVAMAYPGPKAPYGTR